MLVFLLGRGCVLVYTVGEVGEVQVGSMEREARYLLVDNRRARLVVFVYKSFGVGPSTCLPLLLTRYCFLLTNSSGDILQTLYKYQVGNNEEFYY